MPELKDLAKKKLLETSFFTFMRWTFKAYTKQKFSVNSHHKVLADAFEKVLDGKIKRLKIEIPPRYSKTEVVKLFCGAGFARNPASNFIYTSYSHKLALKCSKEVKDMITCDRFKEIWNIRMEKDTKAKELWETEAGGGMYATSFGGPITGFGAGQMHDYKSETDYDFAGCLIIDDPLKSQDRHRKVVRQEVIDYFTGTLPSRLNSENTPIILIMQRLHPEDLAGYIDAEEPDDWTTIKLPVITEEGLPLWEAKHDMEAIERLARNNEMFSSQYMQNPIKLGGNLIKPEMFKRYSELPYLKNRFITVDTATKDKEHNDYSVFQCWGVGHDNLIYLIDLYRKKMKYGELKTKFISFWTKHYNALDVKQYGYLSAAHVEDKSSGTQLIQEAQSEGRIPVIPIPRNRSKLERVLDILLPKMASGHVVIPLDAPWLHDFETECEEFNPDMSHKHDDQIDPLIDAVEIGSNEINLDDGNILNDNIERQHRQMRKTSRRRR